MCVCVCVCVCALAEMTVLSSLSLHTLHGTRSAVHVGTVQLHSSDVTVAQLYVCFASVCVFIFAISLKKNASISWLW